MALNTWIFPSGKNLLVFPRTGAATTYIDAVTDTLKVGLLQSSYTPDTTDTTVASLVASELSVTGYSGGPNGSSRIVVPATKLWSVVTTTAVFSTNTPVPQFTWATLSAGQTIGYMFMYKQTSTSDDSANPLLALFELTATPTNGGSVSVQFALAGAIYPILTLTHTTV